MGVSQARSMVYFMEHPKMKGMIWGTPILGNLHIVSDSYIKLHQSHYSPHYSQLVQVAIAFQIHAFPFFHFESLVEWTSWDDRDRSSFCRWLRRIHLFWTADLLFVRLLDIKKHMFQMPCGWFSGWGRLSPWRFLLLRGFIFCCCCCFFFPTDLTPQNSDRTFRMSNPFDGVEFIQHLDATCFQADYIVDTLWQLNITENQLLECINHETM